MSKDLEIHLAKAKAVDEGIKSFSEKIGNIPTPWEKGDIITFPAKIEGNSFKRKIGTDKFEYIVVTVKSVDGTTRPADFFPSLFRRRVRKCDIETRDDVPTAVPTNEYVAASGSIVDKLYAKSCRVNDVVTAILGKSITISEVHEVDSCKYGTTEPAIAKVFDFEPSGWAFEDEAPAAEAADAE